MDRVRKFSFLVYVIALTVFMCGCESQEMANIEENKAVIRRFTEAVNKGDHDLFDELLTPNFVRHSQATPEVQISSREDFKRFDQETKAIFPDARIVIDRMVAEGDLVAAYSRFIATQEGQMGPYPPSGKQMEIDMGAVFRLEDGKIAELWITWDNLAGLTQLGHFPPPTQSEE